MDNIDAEYCEMLNEQETFLKKLSSKYEADVQPMANEDYNRSFGEFQN